MNILESYENFAGDEMLLESKRLQTMVDEFLDIPERQNIQFGIIVATYRRKDGTTPDRLRDALESISNQTSKNYKIYLMGDDYENDHEIRNILEDFDQTRIEYENMDIPGERYRFSGHDLWHSGSNFVANIAIEKAIKEGMTHMARLDHDDMWLPGHLHCHAKAITAYPEAKFFSTTALIKRFRTGEDNYTRPDRSSVRKIDYNNLKTVTDAWHSTISWDLSEFKDLRYRNVREQMLTEPVRAQPRGGDRDIMERMKMQLKEKNGKWINIPIITMLYRNKMGELPTLIR